MSICERLSLTLSSLSLMPEWEFNLWRARLLTDPQTAPDRWFARILNAILKRTGESPDSLLPRRMQIDYLSKTSWEILKDALGSGKALFARFAAKVKK